jgi:putative membrane protein
MITDHSGVNKQATALAKKLKVTPGDSELSKSLLKGGAANVAKLRNLQGDAFDKAYVANEVSYHQAVLDVIDKTLIPNARNAELKTLIETARPVIYSHMQHALGMQAAMK